MMRAVRIFPWEPPPILEGGSQGQYSKGDIEAHYGKEVQPCVLNRSGRP